MSGAKTWSCLKCYRIVIIILIESLLAHRLVKLVLSFSVAIWVSVSERCILYRDQLLQVEQEQTDRGDNSNIQYRKAEKLPKNVAPHCLNCTA